MATPPALVIAVPAAPAAVPPPSPAPRPAAAPDNDERIIVALVVNGRQIDDSALIIRRADGFYVAQELLQQARMILGPGVRSTTENGASFINVNALPNVSAKFDVAAQALAIAAGQGAIEPQVFNVPQSAENNAARAIGTGGFLNYDVVGQAGDDPAYLAAFLEGGWSFGGGSFTTTGLSRPYGGSKLFTRYESAYVRDLPSELARLKLGDGISRGGDWGTPYRFGGIQFATNFDVQPGFVPIAVPAFAGQAALPSTIDVYLNNALRYHGTVDQGPFALNQIPSVQGGGEARVVLTDPLGRQESVALPFYVSPQVLKEGVSDFSYELGFRRNGYQITSNSYGTPVASATHRYGLTDAITIEGHSELGATRQTIGSSVTTSLVGLGELHGEGAFSATPGGPAWFAGAGASVTRQSWNIGVRHRWYDSRFEDLSGGLLQRAPKLGETIASAGLTIPDYGSLSMSYARQSYLGNTSATVMSANWTAPISEGIYASIYALDARQSSHNASIGLSLTFLFGHSNSATAQTEFRNTKPGTTLQARHAGDPVNGWDYGAIVSKDGPYRIGGDIARRTSIGDYGAAFDRYGDRSDVRLSASGGIAVADGKTFLSRRIDDAFGVVSVPGFPDVTVLQDNRPVGKTDADGDLFLPKLVSNYPAKIALDPADLPISADIQDVEQQIIPPYRGVANVKFDARRDGGQLVSLRRRDGSPVAPGTRIVRSGDDKEYWVALDGQAFVEALPGGGETRFTVEDKVEPCRFQLPPVRTEAAFVVFQCEAYR